MESLIVIATLPLALLNMLGGLISFVWLAVLGEWGLLGRGVAAMFLMPVLFSIAQLPGMGMMFLGSWFAEREWRLAFTVCAFLNSLWTSFTIVVWCIAVAVSSAHAITADNKIPVLLWGYVVAMAPLGYMAGKERDNVFTGLQTLLAQLFYISLVVCWLMGAQSTAYLAAIGVMLLTFPSIALLMGLATVSVGRRT